MTSKLENITEAFVRTIIGILIITLTTAISAANNGSGESRVKIGVLNLECFGGNESIKSEATTNLIENVKEIGFYDVFDQSKIEESLKKVGERMPSHLSDPRCLIDIGNTCGIDRMLYGRIDVSDRVCGVNMILIDVVMKQTIEKVSIQGNPGVPIKDVLKAAVAKLHGNSLDPLPFKKYYGPKVHHEKQFLLTSTSFIGAGLIWGLVNYCMNQKTDHLSADYKDEKLSGIPSSADQIPLFARPAALANSYVAVSDDAYGVLYNPAGMAWVSGPEAVLGYQYRFGLDNLAASFVNKATRNIGFGEALLYSGDRDHILTEMYFVSAIAYKVTSLPSFIRPFSIGANIKIATNRVKGSGEDSPSGASFGAGMDLGLLWELSDQIRYGLLFRDIPVVNRWKNTSTGESYYEANATTLQMGGSFRAGYSTFLVAEGQLPLYKDQPWKMSGAIEQDIFRIVTLRLGTQKEIQSTMETPWKITGGIGLKIDSKPITGKYMILDGSYEYNTLKVFDVVNISLRLGF